MDANVVELLVGVPSLYYELRHSEIRVLIKGLGLFLLLHEIQQIYSCEMDDKNTDTALNSGILAYKRLQ